MTAFAALSLPMPLPCEAPPLIMEQFSGSNRSSNNPRKGGIRELLSKRALEGTESLARSGWLGMETASIGNPNSPSVLHASEQSDQISTPDMILHASAPQRHPGVSVTHTPDQPEEEAPDHQPKPVQLYSVQLQLSREESIICTSFPPVP
jgi:hypothetical protein